MSGTGEPPVLAPMLMGATGLPRDPAGWLFEPKWDGVRAVARVWGGGFTLASRLGNEMAGAYPEVAAMGRELGGTAVLDGEIVALDGQGRPDFGLLQKRMHVRGPGPALTGRVPVTYVVFDLLWLEGRQLTGLPLVERRQRLGALGIDGPHWQTSPLLAGPPDDETLEAGRLLGLEGFVGKRADSPYLPGRRSKSWTKLKGGRRREFVVGGWSPGSGRRAGDVGSLAVGWVDPSTPAAPGHPFALRYAGQVGSGLSGALLSRLGTALAGLAAATSPFVAPPSPPRLHSVRPELVVEVAFRQMTAAGVLRQPSVKGLRDDLDPAGVGWTDEMG